MVSCFPKQNITTTFFLNHIASRHFQKSAIDLASTSVADDVWAFITMPLSTIFMDAVVSLASGEKMQLWGFLPFICGLDRFSNVSVSTYLCSLESTRKFWKWTDGFPRVDGGALQVSKLTCVHKHKLREKNIQGHCLIQ